MYKEPKERSKPVPAPNWTHIFDDKSNKQYDNAVKPAAKPAKADGYMNSGTSKDKFGM